MTFFSIVPRSVGFFENMSNAIKLKVIRDSGINTKPNLNINVTDMSKGYKHFYNSGSVGITFEIRVIINKDEKINGKSLLMVLDEYIRSMTPLLIKTDAIDIPTSENDSYIIVANDSRKQEYRNHTKWDLKFMTYTPVSVFKYANNNAGVLKAIKNAKQASAKNAKLRNCNYKVLKYSKKKKVVPCVKYMQEILYKKKLLAKKQVDGWFGKETKAAVKKFQKAYNKKNKIKFKTVKKGANGGLVNVTAGNVVTNTNNKFINVPSNTKIIGATGKGATEVKAISIVLRTDGKVDKTTWKVLCDS